MIVHALHAMVLYPINVLLVKVDISCKEIYVYQFATKNVYLVMDKTKIIALAVINLTFFIKIDALINLKSIRNYLMILSLINSMI